jgi:hypothetical protein
MQRMPLPLDGSAGLHFAVSQLFSPFARPAAANKNTYLSSCPVLPHSEYLPRALYGDVLALGAVPTSL